MGGAMKGLLLVVLGSIALSGCASMTPLPPSATSVNHIAEKNFSLGTTRTSYVGDPMLRIKDYYQSTTKRETWSIHDAVKVELGVGYIILVPGTYPAAGRQEVDGVSYDVVNVNAHPLELLKMAPSSSIAPFILLIDQNGKIVRVGSRFGNSSPVSTVPADFNATQTIDTKIDTTRGYTNFELIYAGMSGGVLRITYREYGADDLARTAFFQDLTYNVDQKQIRFRDISIEVNRATNESIEFRVVNMPSESSATKL